MGDTGQRVTDFVVRNFLFGDATRLPATDESLLDTGIVDSTGVLEIIEFLEADFAIRINDLETIPENLGSVANITAFVERKRNET